MNPWLADGRGFTWRGGLWGVRWVEAEAVGGRYWEVSAGRLLARQGSHSPQGSPDSGLLSRRLHRHKSRHVTPGFENCEVVSCPHCGPCPPAQALLPPGPMERLGGNGEVRSAAAPSCGRQCTQKLLSIPEPPVWQEEGNKEARDVRMPTSLTSVDARGTPVRVMMGRGVTGEI